VLCLALAFFAAPASTSVAAINLLALFFLLPFLFAPYLPPLGSPLLVLAF
jgi:hypothetical protein